MLGNCDQRSITAPVEPERTKFLGPLTANVNALPGPFKKINTYKEEKPPLQQETSTKQNTVA